MFQSRISGQNHNHHYYYYFEFKAHFIIIVDEVVEEDGEVAYVLQDHTSNPIVTTLLDVNDDDSCL